MLNVAGDEARSREEKGSEHEGIRANIPPTLVGQNQYLIGSCQGDCTWDS